MTLKRFFSFHIITPVLFGLNAVGLASDSVYGPAFMCGLSSFMFTRWGWDKTNGWLHIGEVSLSKKRWILLLACFVCVVLISSSPQFKARQKARQEERLCVTKAEPSMAKASDVYTKEDAFDHLFNQKDRSCRPLIAATKKYLRNPYSFEHIQTGFYRVNDVVHVTMTYRARNAFNGYAISTVSADVSVNGDVSKLSFEKTK